MAENRYGWDFETGKLRVNPRLLEGGRDDRPGMGAATPGLRPLRSTTTPELVASGLPTGASRDVARMALHGLARTGNMILKFLDIPNRVFGNTRSTLQDIYERSEANLERDAYEDRNGVPQVGETAVHLATAGVLGKALPAVFGANVGADTYETAKYAGASEGEALAKGVGHGVVDTAIWTLGQGLASKYLPKAWQWLGRELTGATRGAASSVTSDAVLNSLGADISGEEMAKRAVHAAWMVPLLGMLKMGGKRREEAMSLLRKARPDLAGGKADKVIETIEAEFADPRSQKVALAWVARKGANLPDDTAQIKQALEVSSKVRGLDPMSRSPFEILSDPAYARYLPKPRPQDVKAFSNMKRYPMGVIGFDVSDDAAGRQATREMINAYMSPSSNPWCLATGKDAAKLGELGPGAEGYWKGHSAVPKQIFFQEVDGKLELTAFRATSSGGEGRQEYWDTSDAGYSGIPIKVKVPGDPMGRYRKMVFRPADTARSRAIEDEVRQSVPSMDTLRQYLPENLRGASVHTLADDYPEALEDARSRYDTEIRQRLEREHPSVTNPSGEVPGTFEDIAPGKIFKGDPFRDGRSQTWAKQPGTRMEMFVDESGNQVTRELPPEYILVEDKVRTTENGITKFRTTKYADPTDPDLGLYEGDENLKIGQPVEIEESELVSPEWMRSRGYDPESESDVRRMQQELGIQAWGNGEEAAMAVVPTKRTYMQTKSGTPETVTYGPNGRDITTVDFAKDGVPYRLEYFHSGPADADPSSVYHTIGYDEFPYPTMDIGINEPSGSRLTRNPDSVSPEVLNEVKWDEGLGGFVRTSGNRRWVQKGTGSSRIYAEDRLGLRRAMTLEEAQQEMLDLEDDVVNHGGLESHRRLHELEEAIERHHAEPESATISVEDRQPDGTWAPVKTVKLPSPRREVDADEDDIPMWAQADMTDERIDEEMRELSLRENEGIRRIERERFFATEGDPLDEPVPAPQLPEDDPDWDVQMAAKAGDADRFSTARNFLATDEVPETLFGIPVVADEGGWTERDIEFFREHPEAGGYYDMGDEEEEPPEEPVGEQPMQAASKGGKPKPIVKGPVHYGPPPPPERGAYPGSLNNPGNVERRAKRRRGEVDSPHARWSKFATPQDGLREAADVVRQIADVKLAGAGLPFTIRNWANVYAPGKNRKGEKENDTEKYIRDISSASGLDADAALDRNDADEMSGLLKAIVRFESGAPHSEWFTDDEYRQAALAMQEGAVDR